MDVGDCMQPSLVVVYDYILQYQWSLKMPNKNNQSPEQLIQLHSQYDFGYANFREGVAGWVIMGLAAMVEHETTFKSYTSVSY